MEFDLKLDFDKKTSSQKISFSGLGLFWQKKYKMVLLFFLLCMIALSGYVWRISLSGATWSNERKQEYLNEQNKGVVFDEGNFKKALSDIEDRKNFNSDNKQIKDIFKSY